MAKKTTSKHTHVPTHIGITIIAVVALVFSALLITQYNSNNEIQTNQSHASTLPTSAPVKPSAKPSKPPVKPSQKPTKCHWVGVKKVCL
jgi:hypothetical protein